MNKTFDRFGSVAFALVGALFVAESRKIATSAYGSEVGPNLFPLALGLLLILLSLRLLWETYAKQPQGAVQAPEVPLQNKRFLVMLAATVLYVLLLEEIGYVITTFLFLTVTFRVMGSASLWKSALIALCFSAGVYGIYVYVLKGTLPGLPAWLGV